VFKQRKKWLVFLGLLVLAAGFRIAVAHWLPSDAPDDGRVYAQIARNVLEQHVYSHETEAPFDPSLIRVPGYPLFLAGIYSVFGHTNNGAVRIAEALIDTGTCALVALLAWLWQPDESRKFATAIAAFAVAAVNPFTTIYAATILSEVPTMFLALSTCVAATIAFRAADLRRSLKWWSVAGLLAGLGTMFRPDSGLFAAVIGFVLLITVSLRLRQRWRSFFLSAATLSVTFILVLAPWTIRNWRVFHLFQPLAPTYANMPDEFVPLGYVRWLKTWIDDQQYIDPFWWEVDIQPMPVDDLPDSAFDSDAERDRVSELFDRYNHPSPDGVANPYATQTQAQASATPAASPTPTPAKGKSLVATATPTPRAKSQVNENSNTADTEDAGDENDQSDEKGDGEADQSEQSNEGAHGPVKMTPEIDAAFGEIANERIARHPLRYYFLVPARRAHVLWFNTHSDFYPFEGTLLPLSDLDHTTHQQIWLPLFAALVAIYTLLGVAGVAFLWMTKDFYARLWASLVVLIIVTRLAFFSTIVSPEPRYVVVLFPFLAVLGGIAIARLLKRSGIAERLDQPLAARTSESEAD
jgi:4-amino-4-deoxy-L-arabinose transferase-like glycosyltransferase